MLLKFLIIICATGLCQGQLASHLLFPLENYLKSLPTFKIPQPPTIPVDGELYTISGVPNEKEVVIKETKTKLATTPLGSSKKVTPLTTLKSTTTTTTTQLPFRADSSEIQQQANVKRLPPDAEAVLPEFKPQDKVVRKPLPKGDEEIPAEPQGFITLEDKTDRIPVPVDNFPAFVKETKTEPTEDRMDKMNHESMSSPSSFVKEDNMDKMNHELMSPSAFVKEDQLDHNMMTTSSIPNDTDSTSTDSQIIITTTEIPTTRDLLARFKTKPKPAETEETPFREFLKSVPHIRFSESEQGEDRLRPINN